MLTPQFSFSKKQRLLNASDYSCVFEQADFKVSTKQILILARAKQTDNPRLGLVVSKKNVRLANQRNRLKRQVRESFRTYQATLPSLDIVFLARRGLADMNNEEIRIALSSLWSSLCKKANKLNKL